MATNKTNPAIRRIHADVSELSKHKTPQYTAIPNEENLFEWHFTIRGPKGTDFEGGIYHGRIVLPADYPFKPPAIIFLTPNGRWKTKQKICLSISSYHPEQWQPAWGIRTILEAIISFMTTPAEGAIGAIDVPPLERRRLARESLNYSHPMMPELLSEPEDQNETQTEETETPIVVETTPTDIISEENQTTTNEVEPSEPIPSEPRPSSSTVQSNQQEDRIDSFLGQLSIALLISIFALLYRKALQLYS